ncbi:Nonribosomal peptide synthase sidE [Fusarium oxysporum f. sp. albedinis]|nr:Nonribosomal peptide synthase sidE [Fusarium oxysporum f. sp. albedinis]
MHGTHGFAGIRHGVQHMSLKTVGHVCWMLLCMSPRVLLVTIKAPGLITTPMPMPMPALPSNHTKHRVITCRASKQDNDISQKINTLDAEPLGGLSHPC